MSDKPRIVATILLNDCGDLVVPAIESVIEQVDTILCIDTSQVSQHNRTIALARHAAGRKYLGHKLLLPKDDVDRADNVHRRGWNGSASDARNFALSVAAVFNDSSYAMTLDTDERIQLNGIDLRATLAANPEVQTWLVATADPSGYSKERLFKLPAVGHWEGRTHEAYVEYGLRAPLPYATFSEVAKTPEEYQARFERDIPLLEAEIAEHPEVPRWHCYLGETLHNLKRWEGAVEAYIACMSKRGWPEEGAWAAYMAATILGERLGRHAEAIDLCGLGLARMVTPELAWYAAYLAHKLGRQQDAINLAQLAIRAADRHEERVSFRYAPAWTYKPLEVLHFAHAVLGDTVKAEEYRVAWIGQRMIAEGH